jgi:L-seryl-tRNA(Ser) seleniumtransferase
VGFAGSPPTSELSELAHRYGLVCIDDIGSGCLVDTTSFGLPAEPTFQESLAAGADLVLGSGDKLLGGPQCGILLGHAELIERLSQHPLARAFRIDKLTLAALSATLDAYLRGLPEREIPTLALLAASPDQLLARANNIRAAADSPPLRKGGPGGVGLHGASAPTQTESTGDCKLKIEVTGDQSPVGGGSLPGAVLPTGVLRLRCAALTADELSRRLRLGPPRVFGRVHEGDVVLDLRSVLPRDDALIVAAVQNLLAVAAEQ